MARFAFLGESHADGIGADAGDVPLAADFETGPIGEGLEGAVHSLKKIVAMGLHVEANEIGAKEPFDEFALPGTNAKSFGIRPGNVPENGDADVGAGFLHHAR